MAKVIGIKRKSSHEKSSAFTDISTDKVDDYLVNIENDDADTTDSESSDYSEQSEENSEDDSDDDLNSENSEDEVENGMGKSERKFSFSLENQKSKIGFCQSNIIEGSVDKSSTRKRLSDKCSNSTSENSGHNSLTTKLIDNNDEYKDDSSDEEDLRNTIGNVPINWYDEFPHMGYDLEGKHILKLVKGDTLDNFLNRMENPDFERTIFDKQTGQDVRLSDADLDLVRRVMGNQIPDGDYDAYAPWLDLYSHEVMEMPLSGRPEHKRSFLPSKVEMEKVGKIVHAIKSGWIKPRQPKRDDRFDFYSLWKSDTEGQNLSKIHKPLAAPKMRLPGHDQSFNPPPEYLWTDEQKEKEKERLAENEFWRPSFVPKKYSSLRQIPAWKDFVKDRFERCLDLYLAPRKRIMRIQAQAQDLLPILPKPKDLRPFPTMEELKFEGHRSIIRTISIHPNGKYLASGSDDHTVKIWEVSNGRCLRSFDMDGVVRCVAWNPNGKLFLLAVVVGVRVIFLNPETYLVDKVVVQQTNSIFKTEPDQGDYIAPERISKAVTWAQPTPEEWSNGYRVILTHFKDVKEVVWHRQGDYFATLVLEGDNRSVLMHQLSRWRSQVPFSKSKGRVQAVQFHPKLPFLFVVTQTHIRVYNLQKQEITKKVQANSRWISCIAIHPGGEHFLIGSYDKRVAWFEMECTRRPHVLRYHRGAVRSVAFHRKYPLFASASDDGRVIVAHGMVYNDWLKDPLLVPVKELRGHAMFDDYYVLQLVWHPYEPYLITAGADATIRLWH